LSNHGIKFLAALENRIEGQGPGIRRILALCHRQGRAENETDSNERAKEVGGIQHEAKHRKTAQIARCSRNASAGSWNVFWFRESADKATALPQIHVPAGIDAPLGTTTIPSRRYQFGPSQLSGLPSGVMTAPSPTRAFLSMIAWSM